MTESDFPFAALIILSFLAGFAAAIWLAVAFDQGAREIADKKEKVTEETPP
jgi:hypothetical protein